MIMSRDAWLRQRMAFFNIWLSAEKKINKPAQKIRVFCFHFFEVGLNKEICTVPAFRRGELLSHKVSYKVIGNNGRCQVQE